MSETSTPPPSVSRLLGWLAAVVGAAALAYLVYYNVTHLHGGAAEEGVGPQSLPRLWGLGVVPFVLLLGCIALLPLLPPTHRWWERNLNRFLVSMACSGLTLAYYGIVQGASTLLPVLNHAVAAEYIPFMVLLFSLYVISGGISLDGDLRAHPRTNTAFLAFGAMIASLVGTTGASMLLIRPLLQTNSERRHVVHTVVFFIFLVSNIGGCLLPIGDPPLFLGYLRGVAFFWTLHLWMPWAVTCVLLLVLYYGLDVYFYRREGVFDLRRDDTQRRPLRLRGRINIVWLGGIVVCVATVSHHSALPGTDWTPFPFLREILMLLLVAVSLATTPRGVREENAFNYAAIVEVAALFIGIFIAMQVPVEVLRIYGPDLGLAAPWHFFWATGTLSSFLDNAPTYVVFFETAASLPMPAGVDTSATIIPPDLLVGISLGAVFMGAMTYIGNGPNFMVRAIAEQSGVRMPSFFGYMFKYSIPMLVPVFVLVSVLFLQASGRPAVPASYGDVAVSTPAPARPLPPVDPKGFEHRGDQS